MQMPPPAVGGVFPPARAFRVVFWFVLVAWTYAVAVNGWLQLPGDRALPVAIWMPAFVGVFPGFAAALGFLIVESPRLRQMTSTGLVPVAVARLLLTSWRRRSTVDIVTVALPILVVATLVLLVHGTHPWDDLPGQPDIVNGQYVLNNHGSLTPVSRQEYLRASEGVSEFFLAGAMVFYMVSGLVLGSWRQVGRPVAPAALTP
jgi:hypothetical protein